MTPEALQELKTLRELSQSSCGHPFYMAGCSDCFRALKIHRPRLEDTLVNHAAELIAAAEELPKLRKELKLSRDELRALKHTIVATIGGTDDDGFPTSEINYLQRLRALVKSEAERDRLKQQLQETMNSKKAITSGKTKRLRQKSRKLSKKEKVNEEHE